MTPLKKLFASDRFAKEFSSWQAYRNGRNECHAELLGSPIEVVQYPLAVALVVVVLALIGVFLAFGEHGVDQSGQFVGGGGDGAMVKSMRELKRRKYAPSADWL